MTTCERMLLLLIALAVALLAPVGARADSASSLEVVGSAEPLDAGLIRNVVQPAFEAAFPQYTLDYVGAAARTSVSNAEAGAGGPSVLLLDSPVLESPLVASGYSYNGQPWNTFSVARSWRALRSARSRFAERTLWWRVSPTASLRQG